MKLEFPTTKKVLRKQLNSWTVKDPKPITNVQALRDNEDLRLALTMKLDTELAVLEHDDVDTLNEHIVRSSVEEVCPKIDRVIKKEPWDDPELIQQMKDLRKKSKHEDVRKLHKKRNEEQISRMRISLRWQKESTMQQMLEK